MKALSGTMAALIVLFSAVGAPAQAMVMSNTVVITNTGSTNFIGYRVTIAPGGQASFVSGDGPGHAVLPRTLMRRLKHDIAAASPLSQLPQAASCMKPVSFGTSTFVALGGEHSPDLTCPANAAARALKRDIARIAAFLKLRNVAHAGGRELPPQNF